jgi:hypothetical protein
VHSIATINEIGMNVQFKQILDKKLIINMLSPFLLGYPSVAIL